MLEQIQNYIGYLFETYGSMKWNIALKENTNILWIIFNKIVYLFSYNYNVFLLLVGTATNYCIAKLIYDESEDVMLSTILYMCLYHYFREFNTSRQYLAIAISTVAFRYILNNKNKKALFTIFFAILIHNISIISILLLMLINKNMYRNDKIIFKILMVALVGIIIKYGLNVFLNIFPHYAMYFDETIYEDKSGGGKRIILTIVYLLTYILISFYIKKSQKSKKDEAKIDLLEKLNFLNLISIFLGIIFIKSVTFYRLEQFYSIYYILLLPNMIEMILKNKIFAKIICIVVFSILLFIQLNNNYGQIIPYIL